MVAERLNAADLKRLFWTGFHEPWVRPGRWTAEVADREMARRGRVGRSAVVIRLVVVVVSCCIDAASFLSTYKQFQRIFPACKVEGICGCDGGDLLRVPTTTYQSCRTPQKPISGEHFPLVDYSAKGRLRGVNGSAVEAGSLPGDSCNRDGIVVRVGQRSKRFVVVGVSSAVLDSVEELRVAPGVDHGPGAESRSVRIRDFGAEPTLRVCGLPRFYARRSTTRLCTVPVGTAV